MKYLAVLTVIFLFGCESKTESVYEKVNKQERTKPDSIKNDVKINELSNIQKEVVIEKSQPTESIKSVQEEETNKTGLLKSEITNFAVCVYNNYHDDELFRHKISIYYQRKFPPVKYNHEIENIIININKNDDYFDGTCQFLRNNFTGYDSKNRIIGWLNSNNIGTESATRIGSYIWDNYDVE